MQINGLTDWRKRYLPWPPELIITQSGGPWVSANAWIDAVVLKSARVVVEHVRSVVHHRRQVLVGEICAGGVHNSTGNLDEKRSLFIHGFDGRAFLLMLFQALPNFSRLYLHWPGRKRFQKSRWIWVVDHSHVLNSFSAITRRCYCLGCSTYRKLPEISIEQPSVVRSVDLRHGVDAKSIVQEVAAICWTQKSLFTK